MESAIARGELKEEFTEENKALQRLAVKTGDLDDPDKHLTGTVYTKGAWLMQFMEQRFGRQDFDAFLRGYFDHYPFQSISPAQFRDSALANLLQKHTGTERPEDI